MLSRRSRIAVLAVAVLLSALVGCSAPTTAMNSGSSPTEAVRTEVAETASPTANPGRTSAPVLRALPGCEDLLSIEQVRVTLNDGRVEGPDRLDTVSAPLVLGPAARETFGTATDAVGCSYGIPYSDGGFYILVVEVDSNSVSELESALTASDEYERTTRGNISMFSKAIPEGIGTYLGYAFEGPVWAIVQGTLVGPTTSVNLAADAISEISQ